MMTFTPQRHTVSSSKEGLKRQKYYVSRKEMVAIKCRACGRTETFPVADLQAKKHSQPRKHSMRVDCVCAQTFEIDLEFRQDFRQRSNIVGSLRAMTTPRDRARQCLIVDYSIGGLRLAISDALPIKKDDRIIVRYRPDADSSEVERVLMVRHYQMGSQIGCTFIDNGADLSFAAIPSNA